MANSGSDVKKIVSAATFKRGVEVFESGKLTKISFRGSELEIGEASCLGDFRCDRTFLIALMLFCSCTSFLDKPEVSCRHSITDVVRPTHLNEPALQRECHLYLYIPAFFSCWIFLINDATSPRNRGVEKVRSHFCRKDV